jgi:phage gp46-like protein
MSDLTTFWNAAEGRGDWALAGPDLASGADLETAVVISLFTDRRADADDRIPDGTQDPRGWWGDAQRTRPLGSKLWLLERAKKTEQTRLAAKDYVDDALAWLVEDGIAASVETAVAWQDGRAPQGVLGIVVTITEPGGAPPRVFNYEWAWKGLN